MKVIYGLIILFIATIPAFAQGQLSSNDIMTRMKTDLDLQNDQVTNITPIIDKYDLAFRDLQKSIDNGTINQSVIDTQRQGLEDQETQEISQYLKPYQLTEWRNLQGQLYQQKDQDGDKGNSDADEYSNLPNNNPSK